MPFLSILFYSVVLYFYYVLFYSLLLYLLFYLYQCIECSLPSLNTVHKMLDDFCSIRHRVQNTSSSNIIPLLFSIIISSYLLLSQYHTFSLTVSKEFLQQWSPQSLPSGLGLMPRAPAPAATAARSSGFSMMKLNCSKNVCFHGLCTVSVVESFYS